MDLILVLLLVAVICGGIPLVLFVYMRGNLKISKWLLRLIAFCGIIIMTVMNFPLRTSNVNPSSLIIYAFIGYLLRREYTKGKFLTCMLFVFLANCLGLLSKYFIIQIVPVTPNLNITIIDYIVFLIIVQVIIILSYLVTPDPKVQPSTKRKKGGH